MRLKKFGIIATGCALTTIAMGMGATAGNAANQAEQNKVSVATTSTAPKETNTQPSDSGSVSNFFKKIGFKVHGFMSAGVAKSNSSTDYTIPGHGSIDNKYNFEPLSLAGIQFEADFSKKFAAVIQLVANGDNTNGNSAYRVNAEWAFLRYTFNPSWQARAGRFRLPLFLYSSTLQVGYTYPWVTLPNEVYRIVPFYNINGADVIFKHSLGKSNWNLTVHPFIGQNKSKYDYYGLPGNNSGSTDVNKKNEFSFDENNLVGGVISLSNPMLTLRASYAQLKLNGNDDNYLSGAGNFKNEKASFFSFGAKADIDNLLITGEYAHRKTPQNIASLTGYYGMVGYKIGKFVPNFTYAKIKTTNKNSLIKAGGSGANGTAYERALAEDQYSYTAGLAYYINSNVAIKGSISRIKPQNDTHGLFNTFPSDNKIYLYSLSVDAVF